MAEQVEITNVGNSGVASEATLKLLLAAMDRMAKASGVDSTATKSKINKLLQEEFRARINGTEEIKENTEAKKENTKAVEESTSRFKNLSNLALNSLAKALGATVGSVVNLAREFSRGSVTLTDFSQHIPLIGDSLSLFTLYFDESIASFRSMSQVGAGFNNSLTLMRLSAAESMLTLDQFSNLVVQNAETLRLLGNTVSTGTQRFATLSNQLRRSDAYVALRNLGFSVEEVNQGLLTYTSMQSMLGNLERRSNASLIAGTASYLYELDRLSKVTGRSRRELEESIQRNLQDAGIRSIAQSLESQFGPDSPQLRNFNASMALIDSLGGSAAIALRDFADGIPQTTEGAALIAAGGQNLLDAMQQVSRGADPQILMDAFASAASNIEQFAGTGEEAKAFIDALRQSNPALAEILDQVYRMRQLGEQSLSAASAEQAERERITEVMSTFEDRIRQVVSQIQSAFITEDVFNVAASAIELFANTITNPAFINGLTNFISEAVRLFTDFINNLTNFDFTTAVNALLTDITGYDMSGLFDVLKDTLVQGFKDLITSPAVIAALVAGVGLLMLRASVANGGENLTGQGIRSLGRGTGSAIRSIGRGIGAGLGGIISGIGNSLAMLGPKAPLILAGAAAVGGAITLIGAGIAGASWIMGSALPTLSEGLQSFEDIDGKNLIDVGLGLIGLSTGLIAFGAGSVVSAVGNIASNILEGINTFFGGSTVFDKIEEFAAYNFDVERIENNARAVTAFGLAMTAAGAGRLTGSVGNAVANLVDGIVSFFGGETLPYSDIIEFTNYSFDYEKIQQNATAIRAFAEAFQDFPEINTERVGGLFGAIGFIFSGSVQMPWDQINEFGSVQLNRTGIIQNSETIRQFSEAFQDFPEINSERVGGLFGAIGFIFSGSTQMPWDRVNEFANVQINSAGVTANATAIRSFADAFRDFPEINGERVGGIFNWIASIFTGSEVMPWERVREFGQYNIEAERVTANANALVEFARGIRSLEGIDFGSIEPINNRAIRNLENFGEAGLNLTTSVEQLRILSTLTGIDTPISTFNSALDTDAVSSYSSAIEELRVALRDLNSELSRSNDTLFQERLSSGELMQNITTANITNAENIQSLNTTLLEILRILTQNMEIDTRIERNTRTFGSDISRGTISNL